jgi:hypothetical protein
LKRTILFVVAILAGTALRAQPLRVGTVTIRALDVYSETEATRGAVYSVADRLHVETRKSVIRKFLLFREGDEFHHERLEETERNLRALHFLKSASVVASPPHDGVVDVVVTTQDSWSVAPETQASNKGGGNTFGASLAESNLFGSGRSLALRWDKNTDRSRLGIDLQDPALNSSFWNARLAYTMTSDGYDRLFVLRRPFYSFATPWAVDVVFQAVQQNDRRYAAAIETSRFRRDHLFTIVSFGRALDPNDVQANRVVGGLRLARDEFSPMSGDVVPESRDFRYLFIRYDHARNRFVKLNFINKDLRYEDFNLGRSYTLEAAVSPRAVGARDNTFFTRACFAEGFRTGANGFVIPSITGETRFNSGVQNTIGTATVNYVQRYESDHPSATVGRIAVNAGWRVDRDQQFFADGLTGLRAYRLHAFAGSRSFVANLEQRLYLGREVGQLVSPGVVAFIDAGNATYGGTAELMKLKADIGIGIRIGLPRTPKNLLRIDLAYPLNPEPRGRRGMLISFASGQAF